jgi:hypothetical protein
MNSRATLFGMPSVDLPGGSGHCAPLRLGDVRHQPCGCARADRAPKLAAAVRLLRCGLGLLGRARRGRLLGLGRRRRRILAGAGIGERLQLLVDAFGRVGELSVSAATCCSSAAIFGPDSSALAAWPFWKGIHSQAPSGVRDPATSGTLTRP